MSAKIAAKPEWNIELFNRFSWIYNLTRPLISPKNTAKKLKAHFPKKTRLLADLGGGAGIVTNEFEGAAEKLMIIDPSYRMVETARSRGMDARIGTAEKTGLKSNSCDVILCIDSLHHFTEPKRAITEMRRILSDKGIVLVEEFDRNSLLVRLFEAGERLFGFGSKFYTPDELKNLFEKGGFKTEIIGDGSRMFYLKARKQ